MRRFREGAHAYTLKLPFSKPAVSLTFRIFHTFLADRRIFVVVSHCATRFHSYLFT